MHVGEKSSSWFGYMGQVLRVNLTQHKYTVEPLNEDLVESFIGDHGFGIKMLFNKVPKGGDPLGPNNMIGFINGFSEWH